MNRLNQHRLFTCLDVDVTKCAHRHAAACIEVVQQTFRWRIPQLLLHHPKQIGFHGFELKMRAISNAAAALHSLGAASLQCLCQQTPTLGNGLMGTGGNFADRQTTARIVLVRHPCDHVPTISDVNSCLIMAAIDSTSVVDGIQFGMQRPTENVKR